MTATLNTSDLPRVVARASPEELSDYFETRIPRPSPPDVKELETRKPTWEGQSVPDAEEALRGHLEELWLNIAKPVLDALGWKVNSFNIFLPSFAQQICLEIRASASIMVVSYRTLRIPPHSRCWDLQGRLK